jgi:hypothetical protein
VVASKCGLIVEQEPNGSAIGRIDGAKMMMRVVYMPVEVAYVDEVDALLERRRAEDAAHGGAEPGGGIEPGPADSSRGRVRRRSNGGGTVWTQEQYAMFMAAPQESYRRVRAFADALAESPGGLRPTSEVVARAGLTASQIRAALGKFTMFLEANFDTTQWPFGWAYGPEVDPDNPHEYHYEMSAEQSEAWRAARATAGRA